MKSRMNHCSSNYSEDSVFGFMLFHLWSSSSILRLMFVRFGKTSAIISSHIFFSSICFPFWDSDIVHVRFFVNGPTGPWRYSFFCCFCGVFFSLFSFCCSDWVVSVVLFLSFYFILFIYLFLALLGLRCCASSSLAAMLGLLVAVASLVAEHGLWGCAGFRSCGVWAP